MKKIKPPNLSDRFLYNSYRRFHIMGDWRKLKFTTAGRFVFSLIVITACLGLNTLGSMVYQFFSLVAPLFLISLIMGLRPLPKISISRILPDFATAGTAVRYSFEVTNLSGKKQENLSFREKFKDPRPSMDQFLHMNEPQEKDRNAWDRRTKVYRWWWLVRKNLNADVKETPLPMVPPKGSLRVEASLTPLSRGFINFHSLVFMKPDPLGLVKSMEYTPCAGQLLVLPRRYRIPAIFLPGKRKYHAGGVAFSSSIGNADEFVSLREYRPGDPLRQVHWKSWAKTGKLIIRENQDEHFVRHAIFLDTFLSRGKNSLFEEAVSIAASFAATRETGESLLDFFFAGDKAYCVSTGRGVAGRQKILELLAVITPTPDISFDAVSNLLLQYRKLMSGCIFILTDFDQQRQGLINALKSAHIPVKIFLVVDQEQSVIHNLSKSPGESHHQLHLLRQEHIQEDLDSYRGFQGNG